MRVGGPQKGVNAVRKRAPLRRAKMHPLLGCAPVEPNSQLALTGIADGVPLASLLLCRAQHLGESATMVGAQERRLTVFFTKI